jgi:hypothetical protein
VSPQDDVTAALTWLVDTVAEGEARGEDERVLAHQIMAGMKVAE